ncbi:MAG: nucleoside hydrolase [Brevefilum sp.]|nr:nucleoside hydrolase [Brevefilum sp.]MDT8381771.1 nucleoside hydrolase [Brevefilum sp.]MDW7754888.1 nucleoside hydrolase [Brevefilum sp.]
MNRIPVILDCDTGVDDAIAIMLINKLPQFNLLALTSVAGNVELEKTTNNALRVLELIKSDIPVYRGAAKPIFREHVKAVYIHGENGLGGIELPQTSHVVPGITAWDYIYQEALKWQGELEIIAIGPLTNLGLAFIKYKQLPELIKRIVIMGGSASIGNVTPAAEFNIYVDPEAADIVFRSGVPVYMCGLDITMKAYLTAEEISQVGALGTKPAKFFQEVAQGPLNFSLRIGLAGMSLHDPAAVLYASDPSIFETHQVGMRVETKGPLSIGRTVTDLYSDTQWQNNGFIITDVDRKAFYQKVIALMSQY